MDSLKKKQEVTERLAIRVGELRMKLEENYQLMVRFKNNLEENKYTNPAKQLDWLLSTLWRDAEV